MKTLPIHIAPFSNEYIPYQYDRRSHCSSKTVNPLFKTKRLLVAFQSEPLTSLNAIVRIVINSLLTKECEAFSNVSVFGVHTENGSFQNGPLSHLCVFISVFEKLRFHSGVM